MGTGLENARALYIEGILEGDYERAVDEYTGERYTQHSTPVKDGREGFIEFFADFIERNPVRDITIVRGFQDGRHVFLQALQDLNDGEFQYVTADIFDTDDQGRMIEHWDIIEEVHEATAGDRTVLDGPTEPSADADTAASKALVTRFVDEVLTTGELDRLDEFVAADLAQHRHDVADGIDAWRAFLSGARVSDRHLVVGSGDLVATLAEYDMQGKRHAVIDLYRVADGRIAEHWDVSEAITPRDTWMNSGKF